MKTRILRGCPEIAGILHEKRYSLLIGDSREQLSWQRWFNSSEAAIWQLFCA